MKTYSTAEVAEYLVGDSLKEPERWLLRQIRSGRVTARKIGRGWRMTEEDVAQALASFVNGLPVAPQPVTVGRPSAASMRRRIA